MAFLPSQVDRRYILSLGLTWLAIVSAAFTYCHMHGWIYPSREYVENGANIWLLSRWMFWPFVLPAAFSVIAFFAGKEKPFAGLVLSIFIALFLGGSHAYIVNNVMGLEESFLGTFYYMVPIILGTYAIFLAVSLVYVRRLPDVRDVQKREEPTLVVNKGRTIVWLKESQVDWMQAARNYVDVHADGQTYILRNTLSKMEETLESQSFVRVHRSYIVNRKSIDGVNKNRDGSALVLMKDGSELPCGRAYRNAFLARHIHTAGMEIDSILAERGMAPTA